MKKLAICTLGLAVLAWVSSPRAVANEEQPAKEIFKVEGKLTAEDPPDGGLKGSKHKVHPIVLKAGKLLRFDAMSRDFDTFLRLHDDKGKILAEDDDGGDGLDSRIVFKITRPGTYKLVVTSADQKLGVYTLSVVEATQDDVLFARAGQMGDWNREQRRTFLNEVEKHLKAKGAELGKDDVKLAEKICGQLEGIDMQQAGRAYVELSGIFGGSSNKNVTQVAAVMLGISRRLPGKELDIKGTRLNGQALDLKSYRGKVVLVDFWATWCGPCRGEFPNLKRLLEAYQDRGFAIVGVSIDENHEALQNFLQKEKLPWPCLHEKDHKAQPLSLYYGVEYVPLAILVGRDGKVIAMNAHGAELERLLEKHIGPPKGK